MDEIKYVVAVQTEHANVLQWLFKHCACLSKNVKVLLKPTLSKKIHYINNKQRRFTKRINFISAL